MKRISATEFKAKCLGLLDEVHERGASYIILKRGKVVARVIPAADADSAYPQKNLKGSVDFLGDVMSPALPDSDWEAR